MVENTILRSRRASAGSSSARTSLVGAAVAGEFCDFITCLIGELLMMFRECKNLGIGEAGEAEERVEGQT